MAKNPNHLASGLDTDDAGGVMSGLLAEEDEFDRRTLWRVGSWGVGATTAVILAVMANQSSFGAKRDPLIAIDQTRQTQQIQLEAKEAQNEARRLASAIETLNSDRDRLYSRVTSLEQGLDSVTGNVARQNSPANSGPQSSQVSTPAPAVAAVTATPAAPAIADKPLTATAMDLSLAPVAKDTAKSEPSRPEPPRPEAAKTEAAGAEPAKIDTVRSAVAKAETAKIPPAPLATQSVLAPTDSAVGQSIEPSKALATVVARPIPEVVALAPTEGDADPDEAGSPRIALQRTEFGVDLGSANSVNGLRALWRGLLKSKSNTPLTGLRPIIVVKEGTNGLGMQLRLVAGPLNDAGAAARICAVLAENKRGCETAIFDGQRLSEDPPATPRLTQRGRGAAKRAAIADEAAKKPEPPTATVSLFGKRN